MPEAMPGFKARESGVDIVHMDSFEKVEEFGIGFDGIVCRIHIQMYQSGTALSERLFQPHAGFFDIAQTDMDNGDVDGRDVSLS